MHEDIEYLKLFQTSFVRNTTVTTVLFITTALRDQKSAFPVAPLYFHRAAQLKFVFCY